MGVRRYLRLLGFHNLLPEACEAKHGHENRPENPPLRMRSSHEGSRKHPPPAPSALRIGKRIRESTSASTLWAIALLRFPPR